jgi:serine phosphatase RsbU (regulator of sigma subunit)
LWWETGTAPPAAPLLRRAVQRYTRWGAARKAKQLAAAHGQLLDDASGGSALGGGDGARIDALVIIKASQAISEEVDLDALIQRLLGIVVQSTGAERGAIVLKDDAGAMVHRSDGRTLPLDERAELAATIVHYVLRTAKPLVLADAAIDSVYGRDPHVRRGAAKSVLCVPLIAHGKTGGAIYLEHGLVRDAFGHGRLQLLELLAAQAAISVDNARLYTTLVAKNRELERALELVEENVRLHKELEIGARIQTGILPTALDVPGLELAASMLTASEVGGDYYDILPRPDGAWIGIGDVAGHGLNAGVVMLMTQSAISTLGRERPDAQPSEILCVANELVFDNVRHRLRRDEHVTLSLLRYERNGRVLFAGAHEDILVHRARSGQCERVATPGTWLGLKRDIRSVTTDHELMLEQGDTLVLYTDGVIEAMSASREQFGLPRLSSIVEEHARDGSAAIRDRIVAELARWSPTRADDMTIVVARHG